MSPYRRTWRRKDGKLIPSKIWQMSAMVDGDQNCKSTGSTNKREAQKREDAWRTQVAQGQFSLLRKAPQLPDWAEKYLESVEHPNTRRRYKSSKANLVAFFGDSRLDHISVARIEEFKRLRREGGAKTATINRDLRFLAQILKQAERERYIGRSPLDLAKFFANETRERRKPHILSYEEQEKLLAGAPPRIRVLTVLGVETGMRTGEMLGLRWEDIDLLNGVAQVVKSKSIAGIRSVPLSTFCKSELLQWRKLIGPEFSEWVFPTFSNRRHPLQGGRKTWAGALKKAGIPFFPHLPFAAHICVSNDRSGGFPDYDCTDARTLIDPDCSSVRAGSGPQSIRSNEEARIPPAGVHFEWNPTRNLSRGAAEGTRSYEGVARVARPL